MAERDPAIVLAATLHDPTGALRGDVARFLPRLQRLYRHVAVTTSPATSARLVDDLRVAGAYGGTPSTEARGPLYRLSLRRALAAGGTHVHYLDFDRALHWMRRAPRELAAVLRLARRWQVLLVGRTAKAHRSHQRPLHATETVVNRLIADALGVTGRVDFLAPSLVLDAARTAALLRQSRSRDVAVYGEWPALLAALGSEIGYVECRGLDWETPDRARRTIRRIGLAAWRRRFEGAEEWALRTALAEDILRGFARSRARARRPIVLRRLPPRVG